MDPVVAAAGVLACVAVAGALLVVDPRAEEAFESIKRLTAVSAAALAAALLSLRAGSPSAAWHGASGSQRVVVVLVALVVVLAFASTAASPFPSADSARRGAAGLVLLIGLGASSSLDGRRGHHAVTVFLAGAAVNATVTILQALSLFQPFDVEQVAGRANTGALLGNEGLVALVMALAVTAAAALATGAGPRQRPLLLVAGIWCGTALLTIGNMTALAAATAGLLTVVAGRVPPRRMAAGALVAVLLVLLFPPTRQRLLQVGIAVATGRWSEATTFRAGPWAAAIGMTRERPWLGHGPGTFASAFTGARLDAEIRDRTRYVTPGLAGAYAEAHSDPLQAAAELGWPAAAALLAAFGVLLASLLRHGGPETRLLLPFLVAGATCALAWFPFQRAATAVPLLLALGRAWRTLRVPPPSAPWRPAVLLGVAALAVALPEPTRHGAERALYAATSALRLVLQDPSAPPSPAAMAWAEQAAATAARHLPGDPRPPLVLAVARLHARDAAGARARLHEGFRGGERPELLLEAGRAYMMEGRREEATVALLRAGWASPALLSRLPAEVATLLLAEITRLEADLRAGRLHAPPALPPEERALVP